MADRKMIATEMVALKNKVRTELQRRKYNPNMSSYGAAAYNYTVAPDSGTVPRVEHFNKNRNPLAALNASGLPGEVAVNGIAKESDMAALEAKATLFVSHPIIGGATDCASSCAGLCVNACSSGCTSCTSCSGYCGGNCLGSCNNCSGCGSSCGGGCTAGCFDGCYD